MPFLRFSRDKRGYETTAVVHAFRRQGRARPRILYWFRGPIDVKVGRSAIDEEAIRLIEERHPELSFDWPKILESRGEAWREPDASKRPEPPRAPSGRRGRGQPQTARPYERARSVEPQPPRPVPPEPAAASAAEPAVGSIIPGEVTDTIDETEEREATASAEPARVTAAQEAFSAEDLTRLRARFAAICARIDEDVADPDQAERLRATAEALNPDCWVTPEDVKTALERYEQTYRELREALGPRRKKPTPPETSA